MHVPLLIADQVIRQKKKKKNFIITRIIGRDYIVQIIIINIGDLEYILRSQWPQF